MALNKLVGGDCGGNNPLVQLSSIVSRDAAPTQSQSQADRFVQEFMATNQQIPQTFNMNSLLNNMPDVSTSKVHQNNTSNFIRTQPWMPGPSTSHFPSQMMRHQFMPQNNILGPQGPTNFQIQYINESDVGSEESKTKTAAQGTENLMKDDDEQAYTQFMSFMKNLSAGEMNLGDTPESTQQQVTKDMIMEEMAEKYKDEWAKLSDVSDYWNSETANGIPQTYTFTEGNVMLENKTALEIGKERLKLGDVPGAVLCFEAAVQQLPESAEAWFLLGMTQTENEQDPLAITALKKSLEIDPQQLDAYITLAAAYTNENLPKYAFNVLIEWLKVNQKYAHILDESIDSKNMPLKDLEQLVKSLYLKAARLNPNQIDPEVQNALGVVFNISQEYDKAVDCFKAALMVASDNSKLWNRLGATLANSERSEEAVDAYHQALSLEPGFIRARYNVGITCMNLGAHKQAAEHFLVALNQQNKARANHQDVSSSDTSSATIWTTLRMVCSFMGQYDYAKLVDDRNLVELNKAFEIE